MIQGRDGASFALETLTELGLRDFDRDDAIKARVTRLVDLAHAAGADRSEDLIRAEFSTGRKRHLKDLAQFTRSRTGLCLDGESGS
jgi:hypothetical protein